MSIEAFIITNGRGTFEYAHRSLKEQTFKNLKITVIRDRKWIDAVNECLSKCSSTFFIRVDDDMFLHPYCVEYMYHQAKRINQRRIAAYSCKLWEDWAGKIAGSVKVYHKKNVVSKLGKFRVNKLGKKVEEHLERHSLTASIHFLSLITVIFKFLKVCSFSDL